MYSVSRLEWDLDGRLQLLLPWTSRPDPMLYEKCVRRNAVPK
jgi:hypothetical protein